MEQGNRPKYFFKVKVFDENVALVSEEEISGSGINEESALNDALDTLKRTIPSNWSVEYTGSGRIEEIKSPTPSPPEVPIQSGGQAPPEGKYKGTFVFMLFERQDEFVGLKTVRVTSDDEQQLLALATEALERDLPKGSTYRLKEQLFS